MNRGFVRFAHFVIFGAATAEGNAGPEGDKSLAREGDIEGDRFEPIFGLECRLIAAPPRARKRTVSVSIEVSWIAAVCPSTSL